MNQHPQKYAIVDTLPNSLSGFQTKDPARLSNGCFIIKWVGDEPPCAISAEPNRFQTGIVYWFIAKRNWYTHDEILKILAADPHPKSRAE